MEEEEDEEDEGEEVEEEGVRTESSLWHQLQRGQEGAEPAGGNPTTGRNRETAS